MKVAVIRYTRRLRLRNLGIKPAIRHGDHRPLRDEDHACRDPEIEMVDYPRLALPAALIHLELCGQGDRPAAD